MKEVTRSSVSLHHRRAFLRFVAASPYVAALGGLRAFAQHAPEISDVIASPKEALNVMDFEEAARRKALPGHWAYMASGVDDDLHAPRQSRRLSARSVACRGGCATLPRSICATELFGTVYNSPIFTCPTGGERIV